MTDTGEVVLVIIAITAALPGLVVIYVTKRQQVALRTQMQQQIEAQLQKQIEAQQAALRAQMQEQIEAQQRTIRFLTGRMDEMERARAEEYAETEILRQETDDLRQEASDFRHELRELRNGVAALTRQIEAAGMTPTWVPPAKPSREAQVVKQDAIELMRFIGTHFDMDEITDLAYQLGIDIENVAGENKEAKARSLVRYMQRRKRLEQLRELARSLRPGGEMSDGGV